MGNIPRSGFDDVELQNVDVKGVLKVGGVQITASAAEMNILDGVTATAAEMNILDGVTASTAEINKLDDAGELVQNIRTRVSLAEMNAGKTLLPAVAGKAYRIVDCSIIAIGGAAAATADATGVAIYGTQTAAVKLYEALLAALTQSAINKPGTANTNILADGASFIANDVNTAITVKAVSAGAFDLITATNFDVSISYVLA
jgi:hypothetical protein